MDSSKVKRRDLRLWLAATLFLGLSAFLMVVSDEAAQGEPSEKMSALNSERPPGERNQADRESRPAWWQQYVTFSGDVRAALALDIVGNRDRTDRTNILPVARLRGGLTLSPTSWLAATARLAGFFDKELQGLGFRLSHRRTIQSGDVTFDELFLTLRPSQFLTINVGRLQTEDQPFELDSVVQDSLSRHDSSGLDVSWTDGVYMIIGNPTSFRLHLIGQANPKDGPTNGVGGRGPLDFRDGASRVTYYLALEAPPLKPFTQLVSDVTIIPQALRPLGLGTEAKEDVVAFTIRAAADFPLQEGARPIILHPSMEFGVMVPTPWESVLGVSGSQRRAGPFALVAGLDFKHLGPGALGVQFSWVQAGYLISPDYPNNTWSLEVRYKVDVTRNTVFEVRYRHRQDIDKLVDALEQQTDDNFLARVTVSF